MGIIMKGETEQRRIAKQEIALIEFILQLNDTRI